jgi:subtilisin family serine protease
MEKSKTKKVALLAFITVILTIMVTAFVDNRNNISEESIAALKELNTDYDMVMTDNLLDSEDSPQIMTDIFAYDQYSTVNRGLIANTGEDMILLQPLNEISDTELKKIAQEYNEKIPEIYFEIDQDIAVTEDAIITEDLNVVTNTITEMVSTEDVSDAIRVAVIDSGMQEDHVRFSDTTIEIEDGANVIDENSDVEDDVGHGTHIAGIIAKNAPDAIIIPFKIVNKDGGKLSNVIKAVNGAIEADVQVINMSFGVEEESDSLKEIIEKATDEGIIIVAAAGNFSSEEAFYPAAYDETIAVAATYYSGKKLESSNYGDWVDVAAKGYHIYSSVPYNDYGFKNGTSQAAALVTAKVAVLLSEKGDLSRDEVVDYFSQTDRFVKGGELVDTPVLL